MPNVLDLFSGIGGFSLGLERAGFKTIAFAEIEHWCKRVLAKRWPSVPNLGDIKTLGITPISCAGVSHAKTFQTLVDAPALPESVPVFGGGYAEPFAWYDRSTHLWRTWQRCFITGWTPFVGTWPKSGMTRNGIAYQLPMSERRISARESGFWPTPNVPNGGRSVNHAEQIGSSFYHKGKKVQFGLEAATRMWPTPLAVREHDSDNTAGRYYPNKRQFDLAAAVHLWPTPRANDAEKRGQIANDPRNGLPAAVMYPTPTQRDYRSSMALETVDRRSEESSRGVNLSEYLQRTERNNGSLNPMWVEWLMGFPIGHTDCADSETQSCQKSLISSAKRSESISRD